MQRLQQLVADDLQHARRFPLPARFFYVDEAAGTRREGAVRHQTFMALAEQGSCDAFEEVLASLSAGTRPMMCITPVVDGVIPDLEVIGMPGSGSVDGMHS